MAGENDGRCLKQGLVSLLVWCYLTLQDSPANGPWMNIRVLSNHEPGVWVKLFILLNHL
jgi:hypothetical protein